MPMDGAGHEKPFFEEKQMLRKKDGKENRCVVAMILQ